MKIIFDNFGTWMKEKLSTPVMLIIIIYIIFLIAGRKLYEIIATNENLSNEAADRYTGIMMVIFAISIIIFAISVVFAYKKTMKSLSKKEEISSDSFENKIDAYIVDAGDNKSRDQKYVSVNNHVKKSYWVYGTCLNTIASEREHALKAMADSNIDVRLCMINPEIAIDKLCERTIEAERCVLYDVCADMQQDVTLKNKKLEGLIKEKLKGKEDFLDFHQIIIKSNYFKEYFNTNTNYQNKIISSNADLLAIIKKIKDGNKKAQIELRQMSSFMPMSITIADAEEDNGEMVVEFYVPYTPKRVIIDISKSTKKDWFEAFVEFYKEVWSKAK